MELCVFALVSSSLFYFLDNVTNLKIKHLFEFSKHKQIHLKSKYLLFSVTIIEANSCLKTVCDSVSTRSQGSLKVYYTFVTKAFTKRAIIFKIIF